MKAKKTMLKKLIVLFAAAAMMLSMSMTAFAITSVEKGNFIISGLDDTDSAPAVSAYQIITVNIDDASGQPAYPMYTWNAQAAGWLKTNGYETYVDDTLGTDAVADAFKDMNPDDMPVFLEELAAAIKAGTVNISASKTAVASNGEAEFTDMDMGVYLLTASGGVKIYQPTTVKLVPSYNEETDTWEIGTADIGTAGEMKSDNPTATKTVDDPQVAIGDTVTYTIAANVPDYPADATHTSFIVSDKMGVGLTFNGAGTIAVYSDEAKKNEVSANNYDISTTEIGDKTFRISFHSDFTTTTTADTLYITYTATVNASAFATDALGNDVFLGYDNDPYTDSPYELEPSGVDVYTYGITVNKVDKNDEPLAGAKFKVTKGGDALKFSETSTDGVYIPDVNGSEEVEVSAGGVLQLQGLDAGSYVLTETEAPQGYVLPTGTITVVITDEEPDGEVDLADVTNSSTAEIDTPSASQNVISFSLTNISSEDAGFTLPVTGGAGTLIFTVLGIVLMSGAVIVVVISRKKRA